VSRKTFLELAQSFRVFEQVTIGAEIPECGDYSFTRLVFVFCLTPSNR